MYWRCFPSSLHKRLSPFTSSHGWLAQIVKMEKLDLLVHVLPEEVAMEENLQAQDGWTNGCCDNFNVSG